MSAQRLRWGVLAAAAVATVILAPPVTAQTTAPLLRVHGTATVDAHAARDHDKLVLDGRVLDDGAQAVQTTIRVQVKDDPTALASTHPTTCGTGGKPVAMDGGVAKVPTDEGGRFCVSFDLPPRKYDLEVTADATALVDAATRAIAADLAKRSLRLRFDPEPRVVALDGGPLHLEAVVTRDEELAGSPPWLSGVPLVLSSESGAPFARATSGPGGRASFDIDRTKLGQPGFGELRLAFDGDADTMPSEHRAPVRRDARVTLSLAEPLAPAIPEDGIGIGVLASTLAGPPRSGSLEARVGDVSVGAAPLGDKRTDMTVTFASEETSGVFVKVKYVPDAPYYLPGDDLTVAVPVRGPSPWRKAPLVVCAIAIGAWLLLGRRARRRSDAAKTIVMSRPPVHDGTEGIEVRSEGPPGGPWFGVVVDAHDGAPVARARVAIESPSFDGSAIASVFTDERGRFRVEVASPPPPGSRIVAEGAAPRRADAELAPRRRARDRARRAQATHPRAPGGVGEAPRAAVRSTTRADSGASAQGRRGWPRRRLGRCGGARRVRRGRGRCADRSRDRRARATRWKAGARAGSS